MRDGRQNFVIKFRNLRYCGNMGRSDSNLAKTDIIPLWKPPLCCRNWDILSIQVELWPILRSNTRIFVTVATRIDRDKFI